MTLPWRITAKSRLGRVIKVSISSIPHESVYPWWASRVAQLVQNRPAIQATPLPFLGQEFPLEKG